MIQQDDIEKALHYLVRNAAEAAQARAERVYLTEYRKYLKATIMKEHATENNGVQEREAYADPRYLDHLKALRTAVEIDARFEFLRDAADAKLRAYNTQSFHERAMKI